MLHGSVVDHAKTFMEVAVAGAAIVGAAVAAAGLYVWKKQLRGTTEYDLARRVLLSVFHWKDTLRLNRSSFSWADVENAEDADPSDPRDHLAGLTQTTTKRLNSIFEVQRNLEADLLEAAVIWRTKAPILREKSQELTWELTTAMKEHLRGDEARQFGPVHEEREEVERRTKIVYGSWNDKDGFGQRVDELVQEFEDLLAPHIGRE